jgi:hypothetical protein
MNLTTKKIDNFLLLQKLGIGIEILDYNKNQGWIKMKGG